MIKVLETPVSRVEVLTSVQVENTELVPLIRAIVENAQPTVIGVSAPWRSGG